MRTVGEIDRDIVEEREFIQKALWMYGSEIISGTLFRKMEELKEERRSTVGS